MDRSTNENRDAERSAVTSSQDGSNGRKWRSVATLYGTDSCGDSDTDEAMNDTINRLIIVDLASGDTMFPALSSSSQSNRRHFWKIWVARGYCASALTGIRRKRSSGMHVTALLPAMFPPLRRTNIDCRHANLSGGVLANSYRWLSRLLFT